MFKWNREHGNTPTLISTENLKQAVWGEKAGSYNSNTFQQVINRVRDKIEIDPQAPLFLINKPGRGYLLNTHPLPLIEEVNRGKEEMPPAPD